MGFMHRVPGGESTSTKYFLALVAVVFAFLTSGIVFGYSGLIKVFVYDVKAFAEFCEGPPPCHAQTDRLTLMYTIAATTISGCAIFVGMFLDYFGPRITACVGSIIFAFGLAALAMAVHVSSLLYYLGYFLLALAGPCIFNSLICFGELFPESSAMIIAALNGAFDSSAVVMFAFGQAVDVFGIPFQLVCLAYMVVPVTIFVCSLFLFPDQPFGSGANSKNKGEIFRVWSLKHTKEVMKAKAQGIPVNAEATVPLLNDSGDKPHSDIYNTEFSQQLKSGIFWSMTAVTAFLVLRVNFYIATIFDQLLFTAKMQAPRSALVMANSYTALFNYVLPFGGVLMVPFVGWSLTDLGLGPSFFLIAVLNETFSVVSTLNWIPIKYQIIAFIAYSANRPYLFGAMAAYLGRLFGFRNFGKLFGIARLAGALSTSLISTLTEIAKHKFGGDYFWVNVGFDVAGLLLFIFPVYLVHDVFYGFAIRPKDIPRDEDEDGEPSTSLA